MSTLLSQLLPDRPLRHCWLRFKRHRLRLYRRTVLTRYIAESYVCTECGWLTRRPTYMGAQL